MIVIGLVIGSVLGFFYAALLCKAKITDLEYENLHLKHAIKSIKDQLFGDRKD